MGSSVRHIDDMIQEFGSVEKYLESLDDKTMETKPNDPAKPDPMRGVEKFTQEERSMFSAGLSKREYFAAMAMQGQIAHYGAANPESAAKMAVKAADALIASLNANQTEQ